MWKLVFIFFLFAQCLIAVEGSSEDFAMPKYGSALTQAVADIVSNFYIKKSAYINILFASVEDDDESETLQGTINDILYLLQNKIVVQIEEHSEGKHSKRKKSHNLIFCDTFQSFRKIYRMIDIDQFDLQGYYLIIFSKNKGNIYENMIKIFELLWKKQVVNVNILWMPEEIDHEAIMYTYYPYTSIYCGKAFPIKLNQFRNGKWINEPEYFPYKMINLYGCPLRVATFSNPPFMIINKRDGFVEVDGIDGIMLRVLAQQMNFNVELVVAELQWGELYPNGSSTGALQMVMDKKVNMTIGYFATNPTRDHFMTASYSYHTSNLIWAIPPGRLISSIEKLTKPFKPIIWMCFLSVLTAASLTICTITYKFKLLKSFVYGSKVHSPCLNVVNVVLGGTLSKLPTRNFARTILAMFMLYCLVVQNSYKGGLFKFMQLSLRKPEYSSTDELIENNFTFYMLPSSRPFFVQIPKIYERSDLLSYENFTKMFNNLDKPNFKGAMLTTEDHLAYRNIRASPERYFYHARETILTNNIVIYLPKQSCLTYEIDQVINNLVSGGFIQTWASKFTDKRFLKHKHVSAALPLTMNQFYGVFQLLVCGLIVSFVVFFWELVRKNRQAH